MVNLKHILESNKNYSNNFGEKKDLSAKPKRKIAVVTCMDARLDPAKFMGLEEGDAHVIRNAGGKVSEDVIRSLVVSYKLLGTDEWYIIQHTSCGMGTITNDIMSELLEQSLETAVHDGEKWKDIGKGPGSSEGRKIDWLTMNNLEESVLEDMKKIRNHPLVPKNISIYGFIFNVNDGIMKEVAQTT